jgi:hypothetical protein
MQYHTHNSDPSSASVLTTRGKFNSHSKTHKPGAKKGSSNQSSSPITGADSLTGNSTVSTIPDTLTRPDSPTIASGVKGQPDLFRYQNLSPSTPFEIRNFDYTDGDRIQLPGTVEEIWRQYNIQYQITSDSVISHVVHGNQLVGIVHAQIGITSLI